MAIIETNSFSVVDFQRYFQSLIVVDYPLFHSFPLPLSLPSLRGPPFPGTRLPSEQWPPTPPDAALIVGSRQFVLQIVPSHSQCLG